jgi:4-amino-4-deoxy-L-arabinose transferase-like glycosyltransferase
MSSLDVTTARLADSSAESRSLPAVIAVLLLVATVSIGAGLGRASLWEPDEPRFAEATRQMFARADFVTPYYNGSPRFEKPILFYWLQAVAFAAMGPTDLAARLPAALAGIGSVLLLYLLVSRMTSRRAAFVAALVLATMFRFVTLARQGLTDVPVLFFILAALYGFVRAAETRRSGVAAWLAWAAVGLGVLTKGPVGLLPVAIWGAYAAVCRRWGLITQVRPLAGLAFATLIAAPWYLLMVVEHGRAFVDFALGHEMVTRVLSEHSFAPTRGFFYYLKVWPGDAAPWSAIFAAALGWSALRWRQLDANARHAIVFALTWFACVFILFSLSRSKVPHYVLPAYPAAALVIGMFIDHVSHARSEARWWRVPMVIIAAVVLVTAAGLAWSLNVLMPDAGLLARWLVPVVLTSGALVIVLSVWRSAVMMATGSLALMLSATFAVIGLVIVPRAIEGFKPMPRLAREAEALATSGARIGLLGGYGAASLIYYSHHNIHWLSDDESALAFLTSQPNALCVMPFTDFGRLTSRLPPTIRIVDSAEEFNVRIERLLERRRTPGRIWVLLAGGSTKRARVR